MTDLEKEDIANKIDSEGFDYYFANYGPDKALVDAIGSEIAAYVSARQELIYALQDLGVEVEL